eukprot:g32379.t1
MLSGLESLSYVKRLDRLGAKETEIEMYKIMRGMVGGALAHAFFPRRGEAHFDNDERWSLNRGKGRNLFIVTAHEIGHTLGLEHSPVKNALMSPFYKKLGRDFLLSWDDKMAIQKLY